MSGDCGCGCGGATKVAPNAAPVLAGSGFVRPRFFGGMLLTEDDLQATIEYTLAKRRLTNRHVIGAGVVCGLDVKKHACEPGVVVVSPGYAIDCCGNDLLLSCPEEVNVLDLARDLRRRTGEDCGEPCSKQDRRDYHLYLRYAETAIAPVAPYAPDDCASGECEYSRISEGYRFELRCDEPEDMPSLLKALRACRPPDDDVSDNIERITGAVELKLQAIANAEEPKAPAVSEFKKLAEAKVPFEFSESLALMSRTVEVFAFDATRARPPARTALVNGAQEFAAKLRESESVIKAPEADRLRLERVLEYVANPDEVARLNPDELVWASSGRSAEVVDAEFFEMANAARSSAMRRLVETGETGSDDYAELRSLRLDSVATTPPLHLIRLGKAYLRSIDACTCSAFNPPCPTCSDDAVALAKVRIDGCELVDVCALDRRWVLSPRALSYWFPIVEALRETLEQVCCGSGEADGSLRGIARATKDRLNEDIDALDYNSTLKQKFAGLNRELQQLPNDEGRPA